VNHTVIAIAARPDTRPNRLARRLALDKGAGTVKLVVLDLAGDDAIADRLRPYPHVDWAVVRPDPAGVELATVRPADRWTFLPADAVPLTSLEDLLAGGEASARMRRWGFTTLLTANDDGSNLGTADWVAGADVAYYTAWSQCDKNWRMPPHLARTICLSGARILVCGPESDGVAVVRPDDTVKVVAEGRK